MTRNKPQAIEQWSKALEEGSVFLPTIVLAETVWVLSRAAKLDKQRILSELQQLTAIQVVILENETVVKQAIKRYANSTADFGDCLVIEAARNANALPVKTFDQRFARDKDVVLIK